MEKTEAKPATSMVRPELSLTNVKKGFIADNFGLRPYMALLTVVLVALPAVVAYGIMYRQAINVPYQDDYNVILAFATDYHQLLSLKAKLVETATRQTNDYKLVFAHAIVALELELTGHLNFGFLVALGNLLLVPIAYLLWRTYATNEQPLARRLMEFLPISLIFFSLTYWETLNWAMAGLQNISVVLFSFLSIYLLLPAGATPTRGRVILSCVSAILAAFSSANGFLLAPIGLFIFLRRRAYADLLAWCVSFVLPFVAYLYHYVPHSVSMAATHRTLHLKALYYFLAFLGCVIPNRQVPSYGQLGAAVLGLAVLIVISFAIGKRFDRSNPVAFHLMLWILATGILVAFLRGSIASRYSIYSILLLTFCYSFLKEYVPQRWKSFNRKRFCVASVALSAVLCLLADVVGYQHLAARRCMILAGIEHYRSNPDVNSPMIDPLVRLVYPLEEAFERETLTRAIKQRIYTLP